MRGFSFIFISESKLFSTDDWNIHFLKVQIRCMTGWIEKYPTLGGKYVMKVTPTSFSFIPVLYCILSLCSVFRRSPVHLIATTNFQVSKIQGFQWPNSRNFLWSSFCCQADVNKPFWLSGCCVFLISLLANLDQCFICISFWVIDRNLLNFRWFWPYLRQSSTDQGISRNLAYTTQSYLNR